MWFVWGSLSVFDRSTDEQVGVGQSVGVDPLTGIVIINGHDSTVQGHHFISVNPWSSTPSKATSICKIPAPNVYLLGGSSTVDWDAGVMYAMLVMPPADGSAMAAWQPFNTTADIHAQARYVPNRAPQMIARPAKSTTDGAPPPPPPPPPFSVQLMAINYKTKAFTVRCQSNQPSAPNDAWQKTRCVLYSTRRFIFALQVEKKYAWIYSLMRVRLSEKIPILNLQLFTKILMGYQLKCFEREHTFSHAYLLVR